MTSVDVSAGWQTLAWFVANFVFYAVVVRVAYARGRARERRELEQIKHLIARWKNGGKYTP